MPSLSETITRLAALGGIGIDQRTAAAEVRLEPLSFAGSNPGALDAKTFVPAGLAEGAPLVVVLHGCTQSAEVYDHGAGWSILAERHGFALLYPEQRRANNANRCFNWYEAADNRRDRGELLSIRQMIAQMVAQFAIDPARIFVTGLSAGGALTSALLCAYPEVFAGGAIIAGIPAGSARSMSDAFARMGGRGGPDAGELERFARAQSDYEGVWPKLSIWHGSTDRVVAPSNMERLIGQWQRLAGLSDVEPEVDHDSGQLRRRWRDAGGSVRLEAITVAGMAHGTPIAPTLDGLGAAQAHMIDMGVSSTAEIAAFWGIAVGAHAGPATEEPATAEAHAAQALSRPLAAVARAAKPQRLAPAADGGVKKIIEDTFRSAGLRR
jgi:poly(hydroxyalkanoate) depolymerase family esterase